MADWEAADTGYRFVYFVQATRLGLIKIGYARDMASRMSAMQAQSPDSLKVLGTIECGRAKALEQFLHAEFAELRSHGEWFRPDPILLAFIEVNAAPSDRDEDFMPTLEQVTKVQKMFADVQWPSLKWQ